MAMPLLSNFQFGPLQQIKIWLKNKWLFCSIPGNIVAKLAAKARGVSNLKYCCFSGNE